MLKDKIKAPPMLIGAEAPELLPGEAMKFRKRHGFDGFLWFRWSPTWDPQQVSQKSHLTQSIDQSEFRRNQCGETGNIQKGAENMHP